MAMLWSEHSRKEKCPGNEPLLSSAAVSSVGKGGAGSSALPFLKIDHSDGRELICSSVFELSVYVFLSRKQLVSEGVLQFPEARSVMSDMQQNPRKLPLPLFSLYTFDKTHTRLIETMTFCVRSQPTAFPSFRSHFIAGWDVF